MSRRLSEMDRMLSERHLFHGTSADVVEGICKHNFDPRVCGKHATMFGQGSYFARKAVYSHNFSKRSPKGVHCMFLAKVLTGRCVTVVCVCVCVFRILYGFDCNSYKMTCVGFSLDHGIIPRFCPMTTAVTVIALAF